MGRSRSCWIRRRDPLTVRSSMVNHILAAGAIAALQATALSAPPVEALHLPEHPLQPRIALQDNSVHLAYLTGDPRRCDVQYRAWAKDGKTFSDPVRANSQPGSAVAVGTVRGCELAVEASGRVHIVWNGSDTALPRKQRSMTEESSPVCYTHSDDGKKFSAQQSVMQGSWALDGGASIAVLTAPSEGVPGKPAEPASSTASRIAIVWHGADASKPAGEANRGVFIAWSNDHGQTFMAEARQPDASDGACACCGLHAFEDNTGRLGILYRRAFK